MKWMCILVCVAACGVTTPDATDLSGQSSTMEESITLDPGGGTTQRVCGGMQCGSNELCCSCRLKPGGAHVYYCELPPDVCPPGVDPLCNGS